jgi:hypothetical protein
MADFAYEQTLKEAEAAAKGNQTDKAIELYRKIITADSTYLKNNILTAHSW